MKKNLAILYIASLLTLGIVDVSLYKINKEFRYINSSLIRMNDKLSNLETRINNYIIPNKDAVKYLK